MVIDQFSEFRIFFFFKFADVTLAQKVRAFFFYLTTFVLAIPLFVVMLILQPFVLLFDKQRRRAQHVVNKVSVPYPSSEYILRLYICRHIKLSVKMKSSNA